MIEFGALNPEIYEPEIDIINLLNFIFLIFKNEFSFPLTLILIVAFEAGRC